VWLVNGEAVLADAVGAYAQTLGDRLLGAYALGSLAHGGFSALVSDVDLGLIIDDPLLAGDAMTIARVAEAERAKRSDLHTRLSVFWGTPSSLRGERSGGRFPALDRLDLLESGRLLAGSDDARRGLPRPSSRELVVSGAQFALEYLAGVEIRSPELLVHRGVRQVTKLVLFPVRFLYTAVTGRVGTNDAAADRYLDDRQAPSKDLVATARAWRTGAPFDQAGAIEILDLEMLPLYVHYVDDHIPRLETLGREDLADSFRNWRERLLD
jgi:hypothetical protein